MTKLDQIKAYDIEQFLKQLRQSKASNSRISQCRGMLFQIFNKAVANDLLNKNPAAYADKMRKARPKPKEAFTTREVQLLLKKLPTVKELQTEYAKLLADKKEAYAEYRQARAAMRELLTVKNNVDRVLGFEDGKQIEKERDQKQNR